MKVYILVMGKQVCYVGKTEEEAEYEKEYMEEENLLGRKLGIKLFGVEVDESDPDKILEIRNDLKVKTQDILDLM